MYPPHMMHVGNPSSGHAYGARARRAVDAARAAVAQLIAAAPDEIVFTSCGTESDNWAVWGAVTAARMRGEPLPHVVTTAVEHPAMLACLSHMQEQV
jgi:cysteine desulfurase